jgi:enamine deaminase RidA (YjgF/YER057c/UK114 family)
MLGNLRPRDAARSRPEQAREVLDAIDAGLAAVGMDFTHVVRTWFYLHDILAWYAPFNAVRTKFFAERRVLDGVVPASTGVGIDLATAGAEVGRGESGRAALVADLLAIRPKSADVRVQAVPSPLQCCAREYGSSFSRAVEVSLPGLSTERTHDGAIRRRGHDGLSGVRRLYASGTASIDATGRTRYGGDVLRQVAETLGVVQAILESRGMNWGDVVAGVAYFKRVEDAPALAAYVQEHRLPALPLVLTCGDICRDDLLFELELEASRTER